MAEMTFVASNGHVINDVTRPVAGGRRCARGAPGGGPISDCLSSSLLDLVSIERFHNNNRLVIRRTLPCFMTEAHDRWNIGIADSDSAPHLVDLYVMVRRRVTGILPG